MPVRKFFNNTFSTLLNDACFTMLKKIQKEKTKGGAILTTQGMVKYVSAYLMDNLPEQEEEEAVEEQDETVEN